MGFFELWLESGIFSNKTGEGHSNLHLDQQSQDSCLVTMDSSESKLGLAE